MDSNFFTKLWAFVESLKNNFDSFSSGWLPIVCPQELPCCREFHPVSLRWRDSGMVCPLTTCSKLISADWHLDTLLWSRLWGAWWCPCPCVTITSPTPYQLEDWFLLPFWKSKFIPWVFCSCWWSGTAVPPRLTLDNSLWWSQQNNTVREAKKTQASMVFSHEVLKRGRSPLSSVEKKKKGRKS